MLETYKRIKGAQGALTNEDLDETFDEAAFASALIQELQSIPTGNTHASHYHSIMLGIGTFLWYPNLITPVKEHEIHGGRKRIDIKFTNAAKGGFFYVALSSPQARALNVFVECKNYTKEMNNPELGNV